MKVYTRCLRPDLEYKTMSVKYTTTCRNVVDQLLNKYRMKHRDPNLFFLTMEVATRSTGQWSSPESQVAVFTSAGVVAASPNVSLLR